jgi:hypothetical protein
VAAVKYGGEFTHPMGRGRGKPIKGDSSPDYGNMATSLGVSTRRSHTPLKPYAMSSLAIYMGPHQGFALRIVHIHRWRVLPNFMDSSGATRAESFLM